MNLITVLILAIGLCFDSFAVSLSSGMAQCPFQKRYFARFAFILALFQGVMPLIGWGLAAGLQEYIARYDHWIAFILLALLGVKMIRDGRTEAQEAGGCIPFDVRRTLILGIATSIDALIAGAAMALISVSILPGASQWTNMLTAGGIIFIITFIACIAGIIVGRTASGKLGKHAEVVGGIILILIGGKVLFEHLIAGC